MPVYSYLCEECGHSFDQFQHFTDDPLTVCPVCGKVALRKVYTPVGIVFKGKGFYATDNRSPSGQKFAHNDNNNGNGSGESKTDSEGTKTETPVKEASSDLSKTA